MSDFRHLLESVQSLLRLRSAATYRGTTIAERRQNHRTYSLEFYRDGEGTHAVRLLERQPERPAAGAYTYRTFGGETPEAALLAVLDHLQGVRA